MRYFISPDSKTLSDALDAWKWIGLAGKTPIRVTAFADVFFSAIDGIWFLDTIEGKLIRVSGSEIELDQMLETLENKDHYLLAGFIERAETENNELNGDECYDFKLHPIVGGSITYENIEKRSFLVVLHIRG